MVHFSSEAYDDRYPIMTGKSKSVERPQRHVHHATFEQLSAAGCEVLIIDDGAMPLGMEESRLHEIPEGWKRSQPVVSPKVATLMGADLLPDGSAITPDGRFCYSDSTFNMDNWKIGSGSSRFMFADAESDEGTVFLPHQILAVPGRCFSALCYASQNFGHFVHDVLTRIYYEDLGVIAPGREKVIAPEFVFPIQKALFEKVFAGYEIVHAPPRTLLKIEELLLPANLCSWERFNPKGIAALANRMCRILAPYAANGGFNVCVSRRDGTYETNVLLGRDFHNAAAFETRMLELGYRVLVASSLDVESQFEIWANAASIVGVHGAGMMNMIMMPVGSLYIEIGCYASDREYAACRSILTTRCAAAAGHRVNGIEAELDEEGRQTIDIGKFEALLRRVQ